MRPAEILLIAALAVPFAGCSSRAKMANAEATREVKPTHYLIALDHWSETEKDYKGLETRLIVTATYRSGAFRTAYVDEYARRHLLSETERQKLLNVELGEADRFHEFVFAAYTPESRWNDFASRRSIWRLRLFDDQGNSVEPLVVVKPKQDDPTLREFYPYFTLWSRFYVVKFPRSGVSPDSKTLRFQMTSAVGAAEMTYSREGADAVPSVRVESPSGSTAAKP